MVRQLDSSRRQSTNGMLFNLSPGTYRFGLCDWAWSSHTEFGDSTGTVTIVAG